MAQKLVYAALACVGFLSSVNLACAQDAIAAPAAKQIGVAKTQMEPSLIVLNAGGAKLADGKLVLSSISANSIVFADRPVRAAGHVLTAHLLEEWAAGSDSFAKDPPNATVSVFQDDAASVEDAVVTLRSPKLEGNTLTFDVDVLEGNIQSANGPASVFIDIIGMPLTPMSFAGAARRTAYRGAWYAGAAAGAAAVAASPYRPACGYPYPPCY